jgi:hypothetical protein
MIDIATIQVGDKVHYRPEHYGEDEFDNGLVKEIRRGVNDAVWVVYNCNNEWHRFQDFTGAKTRISDLNPGWRADRTVLCFDGDELELDKGDGEVE